jgi:hypothetical protein
MLLHVLLLVSLVLCTRVSRSAYDTAQAASFDVKGQEQPLPHQVTGGLLPWSAGTVHPTTAACRHAVGSNRGRKVSTRCCIVRCFRLQESKLASRDSWAVSAGPSSSVSSSSPPASNRTEEIYEVLIYCQRQGQLGSQCWTQQLSVQH